MKTNAVVTKKVVKKATKKGIAISTEKKKLRVEYNNMLGTNQQVKEYGKSFNGVRNLILAGKIEDAVKLTTIEFKLLNGSKKDDAIYTALKTLASCSADYKFINKEGKEVHVKYDNKFSPFSVLKAVRNIANNDAKLREFNIKF